MPSLQTVLNGRFDRRDGLVALLPRDCTGVQFPDPAQDPGRDGITFDVDVLLILARFYVFYPPTLTFLCQTLLSLPICPFQTPTEKNGID